MATKLNDKKQKDPPRPAQLASMSSALIPLAITKASKFPSSGRSGWRSTEASLGMGVDLHGECGVSKEATKGLLASLLGAFGRY